MPAIKAVSLSCRASVTAGARLVLSGLRLPLRLISTPFPALSMLLRPACLFATLLLAAQAHAHTICTAIADARTGQVLAQQGECTQRVTPASTFKLAISLMGFDSGFLQDAHTPVLQYQKGDPDWGGAPWLQPTEPTRWMKYSVVWYSQRVAHHLGMPQFAAYARKFDYGNADVSGDAGKNNGLDRAWISSSLQISPLEQLTFLGKLVNGTLPVSAHAFEVTRQISQLGNLPNGWELHGKTGAAYPHKGDDFDYAHGYGWFVGWASKAGRTLVFARLTQDDQETQTSPGIRTRDALLTELPNLLDTLAQAPAASPQ